MRQFEEAHPAAQALRTSKEKTEKLNPLPPPPRRVELGKLRDLIVTTTEGKEISKQIALERLAKGGVVVVSIDGKKISPAYLRAFKDDMLILISPDLVVHELDDPSSGAVQAPD